MAGLNREMFATVIFGAKKKDDDRDRQIRELCTTFPSIRRPQNDESLFEMLFEVNRLYSTLRIFIHADFPNSKPVLQVVGQLNHAWLDKYKWVTGCDKLNGWTRASSLVEIVQLTLTALQGGANGSMVTDGRTNGIYGQPNSLAANISAAPRPPYSGAAAAYPLPAYNAGIQQQQQQPYPGYPNQSVAGAETAFFNSAAQSYSDVAATSSNNVTTATENKRRQQRTRIPDIPSFFPELKTMSEEQLERMKTEEVSLQFHLRSVGSVESMRSLRDQLRESNLKDANDVLAQEEVFDTLYSEVTALQQRLKADTARYRQKVASYEARFGSSRESAIREVMKKKDVLDEETETMARQFVDGQRELRSFLDEFVKARSKYHEISAKLEIVTKP